MTGHYAGGVSSRTSAGAVVSIVHVKLALPTLPAVSVDCTTNVWLPSASARDRLRRAARRERAGVDLALDRAVRDRERERRRLLADGSLGPLVIVTVGAVVSTVQVKLARGAGVAGGVGRVDGERVRAVGERR